MNTEPAPASRKEWVDARITEEEKRMSEQAVSLSGCSVTSFIVSTYVTATLDIIQDHEMINLTAADREAFVTALRNPPESNKALNSAVRNYDEAVIRRL